MESEKTKHWLATFRIDNDEVDSVLTLTAKTLEEAKQKAREFLTSSPIVLREIGTRFYLY